MSTAENEALLRDPHMTFLFHCPLFFFLISPAFTLNLCNNRTNTHIICSLQPSLPHACYHSESKRLGKLRAWAWSMVKKKPSLSSPSRDQVPSSKSGRWVLAGTLDCRSLIKRRWCRERSAHGRRRILMSAFSKLAVGFLWIGSDAGKSSVSVELLAPLSFCIQRAVVA